MTTNVARDLFLLSAVAFRNGKFDQAGKLYSAALSSDDSDQFLNLVQELSSPQEKKKEPTASLSSIAAAVSKAMGEDLYQAVASDSEEEDLVDEEGGDQDLSTDDNDETQQTESTELGAYGDEVDPDEDIFGDIPNPATPGQMMILPSLSAVADSAVSVKPASADKWKVKVSLDKEQ